LFPGGSDGELGRDGPPSKARQKTELVRPGLTDPGGPAPTVVYFKRPRRRGRPFVRLGPGHSTDGHPRPGRIRSVTQGKGAGQPGLTVEVNYMEKTRTNSPFTSGYEVRISDDEGRWRSRSIKGTVAYCVRQGADHGRRPCSISRSDGFSATAGFSNPTTRGLLERRRVAAPGGAGRWDAACGA